jgi:hypothetical protein
MEQSYKITKTKTKNYISFIEALVDPIQVPYCRPFHNNCGPTFIRDICEWKIK